MSDTRSDSAPETFPPTTDDERSDIEQEVEARSDAVARGEGGPEPDGLGGESGADGVVKNQDYNQQ